MDNKLLLDVTSIITFISDICNDSEIWSRFGEDWKKRSKLMYDQIKDEQEDPIFPKLEKIYSEYELIVTITAIDKSRHLIENFGSGLEKENLKKLIDRMTIINDDPSERINKLNSKYWSKLNKSIFGTADKLGIKVISGNINAISSLINEHDIDLKYIAHRSRCFVGKKHEVPNKIDH